MRGLVLTPGDPAYRGECAGFNAAIVHAPQVVVVVESAADAVECVRFARAQGLKIHVQSTGHGAYRPISSGLLVSTRRLDGVSVDSDGVAVVGAGARWGAVMARAAEHGRAPIAGSSPTVGVVGLLLGGGLGPLARSHGFASDYVAGLTLVSASGEVLEVDAHRNPELLWAFRGGKGSFGIVTEVRLRLASLSKLYAGSLCFDTPHIEVAFRAWLDWTKQAPALVSSSVALARFPPLDRLPPTLRGRRLLMLRFAYPGDSREGARLAAPLRAAAPVYIDQLGEMPAADMARIHSDPTEPMPATARACTLSHVDQKLGDVLLEHLGPNRDTPFVVSELRHLGEATRRDVPEGSAVGGREASFALSCVCTDPSSFEHAVPASYSALLRDLGAWRSTDNNINFLAPVRSPEDFASAWSGSAFSRLTRIRQQYDPERVFVLGHE